MKVKYQSFLVELNELQERYDLAIDWNPEGIELRERGEASQSEGIGILQRSSPTFVGKYKTDTITYI